ncbi:hypothetical protein K456DRAFT_51922 [Colletotrichum gloeosporioides 23]|nr:hypothetical protein K456DRAFT_51922 [Colletotrichum gloeosporioides 23]
MPISCRHAARTITNPNQASQKDHTYEPVQHPQRHRPRASRSDPNPPSFPGRATTKRNLPSGYTTTPGARPLSSRFNTELTTRNLVPQSIREPSFQTESAPVGKPPPKKHATDPVDDILQANDPITSKHLQRPHLQKGNG